MIPMHDDDLSQRLHFAESDFLIALGSGTTMLASYYQTWSALPDALHTASKTGNVGKETFSLAHSVASRIANLASCFLDIRRGEESSTTSLQRDCDAMLHRMAVLDLNTNPKPLQPDNSNDACCSRSHPSTTISHAEGLPPPFLVAARQWLLENVHNPYPSAEVKAQMAATSSCQISSINSWFINTRRRIGWTTLCREHFSNCRADMIDAAYRALVEEDPQRALSPELRHSFVAMRVAVEDLYSSTLTRSTFAGDLDTMIKAMTKENGKFAEVGKCCQVKQANFTKVVQDSYPSPDPSITSSPVPTLSDSLTVESEEDEDVAPLVIAGSKRRRSSIGPVDHPSSITSRPIKRLRASATSQTCLPSPPSSTDGIDESSHHSSPVLPHAHSTLPETNRVFPSPKRCLSDADATGIPKCPHGSMATPHLQSVSGPSPSNMENELSIDDWFNANFDALFAIPPPVHATEPDFTAGWEVELFKDYSIPGNPKYATKCSPTPAACMPVPSDLPDLDSLLHSIGSDTPAISLPQFAATRTSYTASLDSSIRDVSQTSVDWTSLLNGTELYQPTVCPTFPQCPTDSQLLPEIDLSMLQFPQIVPVVDPQSDSASRQAKLQQLHAMQEAVWRMEQELRSEGVMMGV
ncbi:C-terminal domain of homeodomain 1-domain-containing protein [Boletus edulis BED1]|uniref:C-terminal domain of homeodomain 1-domain-containing protein n=1 Tax=Boletus edulis BED1 TaxID=1328754 RepID=A0AAD4C1L5_BOLED|nr:C-terminal domain of homeodomain 1-domain-containing protein [Boletus edulis BED1]